MAGDLLDREYLDINGMEFEVETLNQEPDNNSNVVDSMTRNGQPLGMSSGNLKWEITADLVVKASQLDYIDALEQYLTNVTEVPIVVMQEGGRSYGYTTGFVTGMGSSASSGESIKRSITVKAWGRSSI